MSVVVDDIRLRHELLRRGWSAAELARASRLSHATVCSALSGKQISSRSLACIAHALAKAPVIAGVEDLVKSGGHAV